MIDANAAITLLQKRHDSKLKLTKFILYKKPLGKKPFQILHLLEFKFRVLVEDAKDTGEEGGGG